MCFVKLSVYAIKIQNGVWLNLSLHVSLHVPVGYYFGTVYDVPLHVSVGYYFGTVYDELIFWNGW